MSQLAPAKMRLWLEMWKEEVMASIPSSELKHKFQNQQVKKGNIPVKPRECMQPQTKGGEQIL
jgi:hypothetical protein